MTQAIYRASLMCQEHCQHFVEVASGDGGELWRDAVSQLRRLMEAVAHECPILSPKVAEQFIFVAAYDVSHWRDVLLNAPELVEVGKRALKGLNSVLTPVVVFHLLPYLGQEAQAVLGVDGRVDSNLGNVNPGAKRVISS